MHIPRSMGDALASYLDLTNQQMKLTAGNLANVDTPGYQTKGIDFQTAFQQAMQCIDSGTQPAEASTQNVQGLVARPDGNNVSADRESMDLSREQLQFKAAVTLLKQQYAGMLSAIHADAK